MKALVLNSGGCDSSTLVSLAVDKYGANLKIEIRGGVIANK